MVLNLKGKILMNEYSIKGLIFLVIKIIFKLYKREFKYKFKVIGKV